MPSHGKQCRNNHQGHAVSSTDSFCCPAQQLLISRSVVLHANQCTPSAASPHNHPHSRHKPRWTSSCTPANAGKALPAPHFGSRPRSVHPPRQILRPRIADDSSRPFYSRFRVHAKSIQQEARNREFSIAPTMSSGTLPRELWSHPDPKSTQMYKFMHLVNKEHKLNLAVGLSVKKQVTNVLEMLANTTPRPSRTSTNGPSITAQTSTLSSSTMPT